MTVESTVPTGWASLKTLPRLPDREDVWQCYVHKLRTWAEGVQKGENGTPIVVRPYLILVVSVGTGMFLTTTSADATAEGATNILRQGDQPTTGQVLQFLQGVMKAPRVMNTSSDGPGPSPGRPQKITFCDTVTAGMLYGQQEKWSAMTDCKYVQESRQALEQVGVECVFAPVPQPLMHTIIRGQIEKSFTERGIMGSGLNTMPGLSSFVSGFTENFGASLFQTATEFFHLDVWKKIPKAARRPIKVSFVLATDAEGNRYRAQGFA
eukprot:CAMPEP_0198215858 /NCGR_PEP_ID=MMETSP1445-20131203/53151_1 /TAXON_ID=36898 /ORGANISM="Pyramimonas sp., Strain CCMP2087" /LENGTH=265 /DNA_ID=CAMNT_0043891793 /DNA_START=60 /DNA_END=853 /DNA_ORIENTATION=-